MRLVSAFSGLLLAAAGVAASDDPFGVSAALTPTNQNRFVLSVGFRVPPAHHLYTDRIEVEAGPGVRLDPQDIPVARQEYDEAAGQTTGIYDRDVVLKYLVTGLTHAPLSLTVTYQGCAARVCFAPQTKNLLVNLGAAARTAASRPEAEPAPAVQPAPAQEAILAGFAMIGRAAGYLSPEEFVQFLDSTESGKGMAPDRLQAALTNRGLWVVLLLILIGGLALNLTPCVLPMIPVNIAIIGAGSQSGSRTRGFALGGTYGGGMAVVYGLLGLAVVLTGSRFGRLNSSPWFNLGIAALFLVMALAMFGVINMDFSRFQGQVGAGRSRRRGFVPAFALGGIAALLAGACVAPILISVLVLSSNLYAQGNAAGLLLPFMLGIGMALPWPFAGAGLSFLPKPGRWMEWVKHGFGTIILVFALWYGWLGATLALAHSESNRRAVAEAQQKHATEGGWMTSLDQALARATREKKPLFVDCWASWCKNCLRMEKNTFRDPNVTRRLEPYVRLKFRAEKMDDPEVKPVLDRWEVLGLPTYVILQPLTAKAGHGIE